MPQYLFQLGNTPELSISELTRVCGSTPKVVVPDTVVALDLPENAVPADLMQILGGTVKIFAPAEEIPAETTEALEEKVLEKLLSDNSGKIQFGVAEINREHLPALNAARIKAQIQEQGSTARYVDGPRSGLSASVLSHKKAVREIVVLYTGSTHLVTETLAVQDIDAWSFRDRSKPYADRKKGMLPPKLARIMVNIAFGTTIPSEQHLLLDPFCGSGTVLIEALMRGTPVFGSDLDEDAVMGTIANLKWLKQSYDRPFGFDVARADATHVTTPGPVTHLVTEPFLGKPRPQPAQLPNIYKGLEKQYWGSFKHWTQILSDQAQLVVVFPVVELPGKSIKRFSLDALIDKLATLGYTTSSEPVVYRRPQAVVQRQIYHFTYTKK